MTHGDDSQVDRHGVDAFASEDELTIQQLLHAAPTAPARPEQPQRPASSLYQRIGCAGGLLWLVNTLYLRVLADPLLLSYFKHLDGRRVGRTPPIDLRGKERPQRGGVTWRDKRPRGPSSPGPQPGPGWADHNPAHGADGYPWQGAPPRAHDHRPTKETPTTPPTLPANNVLTAKRGPTGLPV
jgi:hypothetical protein